MPSYNYVGVGNSTNKKDAQANAAKDFVQFLVRQGEVNPSEVPEFQVGGESGGCLYSGGRDFNSVVTFYTFKLACLRMCGGLVYQA